MRIEWVLENKKIMTFLFHDNSGCKLRYLSDLFMTVAALVIPLSEEFLGMEWEGHIIRIKEAILNLFTKISDTMVTLKKNQLSLCLIRDTND